MLTADHFYHFELTLHGKCITRQLLYELQLNFYIFRCVFKSGVAMCGWNGHAVLCAEYRNAAEEVWMPPAFVGD
jgi:hypothetical protein